MIKAQVASPALQNTVEQFLQINFCEDCFLLSRNYTYKRFIFKRTEKSIRLIEKAQWLLGRQLRFSLLLQAGIVFI